MDKGAQELVLVTGRHQQTRLTPLGGFVIGVVIAVALTVGMGLAWVQNKTKSAADTEVLLLSQLAQYKAKAEAAEAKVGSLTREATDLNATGAQAPILKLLEREQAFLDVIGKRLVALRALVVSADDKKDRTNTWLIRIDANLQDVGAMAQDRAEQAAELSKALAKVEPARMNALQASHPKGAKPLFEDGEMILYEGGWVRKTEGGKP